MMHTLKRLWNDEVGFVISAELVLVMTIGVLAMVVGLHSVAKSVAMELNDVANAIGTVDQSYSYNGLGKAGHCLVPGSAYQDGQDDCDCQAVIQPAPTPKTDPGAAGPESG